MLDLKGEIGELKTALVETGVDVGPAIYLARTFNTDIDTVVKFFIFILIFVFDPLAVMLVIAYNQALIDRKQDEPEIESIIEKSASAFEEDNERMDIIGQNGNDGLHYDIEEPNEPREENDPQRPALKGGVKAN